MKSAKLIREMIRQYEFDIAIEKAHISPIEEERRRIKKEWVNCLRWVLESNE